MVILWGRIHIHMGLLFPCRCLVGEVKMSLVSNEFSSVLTDRVNIIFFLGLY